MSEVKPSDEQLAELRANKAMLEDLERSMTKAELAGIDMTEQRKQNKDALDKINRFLNAYGN